MKAKRVSKQSRILHTENPLTPSPVWWLAISVYAYLNCSYGWNPERQYRYPNTTVNPAPNISHGPHS
jgi:hypothetical protein